MTAGPRGLGGSASSPALGQQRSRDGSAAFSLKAKTGAGRSPLARSGASSGATRAAAPYAASTSPGSGAALEQLRASRGACDGEACCVVCSESSLVFQECPGCAARYCAGGCLQSWYEHTRSSRPASVRAQVVGTECGAEYITVRPLLEGEENREVELAMTQLAGGCLIGDTPRQQSMAGGWRWGVVAVDGWPLGQPAPGPEWSPAAGVTLSLEALGSCKACQLPYAQREYICNSAGAPSSPVRCHSAAGLRRASGAAGGRSAVAHRPRVRTANAEAQAGGATISVREVAVQTDSCSADAAVQVSAGFGASLMQARAASAAGAALASLAEPVTTGTATCASPAADGDVAAIAFTAADADDAGTRRAIRLTAVPGEARRLIRNALVAVARVTILEQMGAGDMGDSASVLDPAARAAIATAAVRAAAAGRLSADGGQEASNWLCSSQASRRRVLGRRCQVPGLRSPKSPAHLLGVGERTLPCEGSGGDGGDAAAADNRNDDAEGEADEKPRGSIGEESCASGEMWCDGEADGVSVEEDEEQEADSDADLAARFYAHAALDAIEAFRARSAQEAERAMEDDDAACSDGVSDSEEEGVVAAVAARKEDEAVCDALANVAAFFHETGGRPPAEAAAVEGCAFDAFMAVAGLLQEGATGLPAWRRLAEAQAWPWRGPLGKGESDDGEPEDPIGWLPLRGALAALSDLANGSYDDGIGLKAASRRAHRQAVAVRSLARLALFADAEADRADAARQAGEDAMEEDGVDPDSPLFRELRRLNTQLPRDECLESSTISRRPSFAWAKLRAVGGRDSVRALKEAAARQQAARSTVAFSAANEDKLSHGGFGGTKSSARSYDMRKSLASDRVRGTLVAPTNEMEEEQEQAIASAAGAVGTACLKSAMTDLFKTKR